VHAAVPPTAVGIPHRTPLRGTAFPDHVVALTWDDGPDADTLELARFLRHEKVSATFFVVREWREGLSMDPGWGRDTFRTGHRFVPVLGDLVRLGHRIGNHTANHVLLSLAPAATVAEQLNNLIDDLIKVHASPLSMRRPAEPIAVLGLSIPKP